VLDDLLRLFHADRGPLLAAVFAGTLLGVMFGWSLDRVSGSEPTGAAAVIATPTVDLPPLPKDGGPKKSSEVGVKGTEPAPRAAATATAAPANKEGRSRDAIEAALKRGITAAEAMGGTAEAAVMVEGWDQPVTAGDNRRDKMRMWSMSKPATAIAAIEAAERKRLAPSAELADAMRGAITRSENCRQRRVVLGLQKLAGTPAKAKEGWESVLARAGDTDVAIVEPPAAQVVGACAEWWKTQTGVNPAANAFQLGVVTWTVADAARFAFALGQGRYDEPGKTVLGLMRLAKQKSRESEDGEYTPGLKWGAGNAFAGFSPAYKAGWGGHDKGNYLAGQYVVLDGGKVALAVMFHPTKQPATDDPGLTVAPKAIEKIMDTVKPELKLR
jgi:hypothetical protein